MVDWALKINLSLSPPLCVCVCVSLSLSYSNTSMFCVNLLMLRKALQPLFIVVSLCQDVDASNHHRRYVFTSAAIPLTACRALNHKAIPQGGLAADTKDGLLLCVENAFNCSRT